MLRRWASGSYQLSLLIVRVYIVFAGVSFDLMSLSWDVFSIQIVLMGPRLPCRLRLLPLSTAAATPSRSAPPWIRAWSSVIWWYLDFLFFIMMAVGRVILT